MITHARTLFLLAPLALAVSACSDDGDHDFDAVAEARAERLPPPPPATVVFDPGAGAAGLPFPIDVVFAGSEDGTLNIPVDDDTDLSDPIVALNLMDGFSTTSPITTGVDRRARSGEPRHRRDDPRVRARDRRTGAPRRA